jgi:hypothetical protein
LGGRAGGGGPTTGWYGREERSADVVCGVRASLTWVVLPADPERDRS